MSLQSRTFNHRYNEYLTIDDDSAYNLRRREVSLPPIPEDAFNQRIGFLREIVDERWGSLQDAETAPLSRQRNPQDSTPPTRCLFCPQAFSAQDNPTEALLNHMLAEHGFTIPHEEAVTHLPSLLRYLSSLVHTWHECVFCGVAFDSATAVQTHMRDAGHCALDLGTKSGIMEFWSEGVFNELAGSDEKSGGQ